MSRRCWARVAGAGSFVDAGLEPMDMAPLSDLAQAADLAAAVDMARVPDMAPPVDAAPPDVTCTFFAEPRGILQVDTWQGDVDRARFAVALPAGTVGLDSTRLVWA